MTCPRRVPRCVSPWGYETIQRWNAQAGAIQSRRAVATLPSSVLTAVGQRISSDTHSSRAVEWRGIARKGGKAREGRRGLAQGAVHASDLPRAPPQAVDPNRSFNPRGEVVAGRSFNPEARRMLHGGRRLSLIAHD